MLGQMKGCSFGWSYSLTAATITTPGVVATPSTTGMGTYVQLASAANLVYDVYKVRLWFHTANTATGIRDILVNIGTDPAGGTSYSQTAAGGINNLFVPQCGNPVQGGRWYEFPFFIAAGSSVAYQAQSNSASTIYCVARFFGQPSNPENYRVGTYSETVGVSGNGGTPITAGATGAEGSWTSIGTTTRDCWWWQLAYGNNVATTTSVLYFADLAAMNTASTTKEIIIENLPMFQPGTAEQSNNPFFPAYYEVPAGSTLYVRASSSAAVTGLEAVAVGIGG